MIRTKSYWQKVLLNTIKSSPKELAEELPIELCDLAEMFWTYPNFLSS
jgi:hypothetical protein